MPQKGRPQKESLLSVTKRHAQLTLKLGDALISFALIIFMMLHAHSALGSSARCGIHFSGAATVTTVCRMLGI